MNWIYRTYWINWRWLWLWSWLWGWLWFWSRCFFFHFFHKGLVAQDWLWKDGGCIAQCEFGPGAKPENVYQVFKAWENIRNR